MNQAEVIHAGWVHKDTSNMSLLDACQADVRDSITFAVELKAYATGASTGGNGPSFNRMKQKSHAREVNHAKQLGAEILQNITPDDNGRTVDPVTSFKPRENKKTRKKTTKPSTSSTASTCHVEPTGIRKYLENSYESDSPSIAFYFSASPVYAIHLSSGVKKSCTHDNA